MQWKNDLVYISLSLHAYWGSAQCVVGRAWITLWVDSNHDEFILGWEHTLKSSSFEDSMKLMKSSLDD